ncbi:MKRN2 opposite strand protein [Planococcus citri]|uniref:MKRN2 opposite strand protein n=1 Tax=Planococcus citri TaxID=170843 RepID=UPI0031F80280
MNNDPGIICFRHCTSSISCYSVPQFCPICRQKLSNSSDIMPFRIPYPFVRAKQTPCSILLKPSKGNFLDIYNPNADLHIGITRSDCRVIEYDFNGLCDSKTESWNECLCIYTLCDISWQMKWDNILLQVSNEFRNLNQRYDENSFNCYSFVLEFVKCLQHRDFMEVSSSKEIFCQRYVIPKMAVVFKYVRLFRILKNAEYYIEE